MTELLLLVYEILVAAYALDADTKRSRWPTWANIETWRNAIVLVRVDDVDRRHRIATAVISYTRRTMA